MDFQNLDFIYCTRFVRVGRLCMGGTTLVVPPVQPTDWPVGDVATWKNSGATLENKRLVGETIRAAARGATSVRQILGQVDHALADAIPHAFDKRAQGP